MTASPTPASRAERTPFLARLKSFGPKYNALAELTPELALEQAKRTDLIGNGCNCLIPARPPAEAFETRLAVPEVGLSWPRSTAVLTLNSKYFVLLFSLFALASMMPSRFALAALNSTPVRSLPLSSLV